MTGLRIGLLGAARITAKAIVEPAKGLSQVTLTGIAARSLDRAKAYADANGVETAYESYEALITSDAVDLIYNPLPINLHAEWTIRALEAGKHVLCEKPFAMNSDEAEAMVSAAKSSGKRLIEAFHYRYHPAFSTCLNWVRTGRIGKIQNIDAVFNVAIADNGQEIRHRIETGGGAMMDLGCYPLHWALSLLEEAPNTVTAEAKLTPVGVDESMEAQLLFGSDATASLKASMAKGERFKADMVITGSEGQIHFQNPLAPHVGAKLGLVQGGQREQAEISPIPTYSWQLAMVEDALRTNTPLPTEGQIILDQQKTLDRIYEAAGLKHLRWLSETHA